MENIIVLDYRDYLDFFCVIFIFETFVFKVYYLTVEH